MNALLAAQEPTISIARLAMFFTAIAVFICLMAAAAMHTADNRRAAQNWLFLAGGCIALCSFIVCLVDFLP